MKRKEILEVFSDFIVQRTMERIHREFYQGMISEMKKKKSREEVLDVFLNNIFASALVTLEQFQRIDRKELFRWGDSRIVQLRGLFHAHSPEKILKEKDAVRRIIYFILDEFIEDKVVRELDAWAREGANLAKLEVIINILGMSGNN